MSSFDQDRKFCSQCNDYVPYLASPEKSFCTLCGAPVTLFSPEDREEFHRTLVTKRKVTPSDIAFGFKKR